MKIKLYIIQEVRNEPNPIDCVGKLHIFLFEGDRTKFIENHPETDYLIYNIFERDIQTE